jgi:hypothetical protein
VGLGSGTSPGFGKYRVQYQLRGIEVTGESQKSEGHYLRAARPCYCIYAYIGGPVRQVRSSSMQAGDEHLCSSKVNDHFYGGDKRCTDSGPDQVLGVRES